MQTEINSRVREIWKNLISNWLLKNERNSNTRLSLIWTNMYVKKIKISFLYLCVEDVKVMRAHGYNIVALRDVEK